LSFKATVLRAALPAVHRWRAASRRKTKFALLTMQWTG
jgi:hypothetical protein